MDDLSCLVALVVLASGAVSVVALILTLSLQGRVSSLESEITRLIAANQKLAEKIREMAAPRRSSTEGAMATEAPPTEPQPPTRHEPAAQSAFAPPPVVTPPPAAPVAPPLEPAAPLPAPTPPPAPEPPFPSSRPAAPFHQEAGPSFTDRVRGIDWENFVGVRLFSWIAGVALALAAIFFLKYSFEAGLLSPMVRMVLGLVGGVGLVVVCEMRFASGYRTTANAMDGSGIAILYATLFASHALWNLIPAALGFALMAGVTGLAVFLSIRRDSVFMALLGLLGGFATPALLSTGQDRPVTLFGYLLILNAGLAWVAYRKRWPMLSVLTLVFTTLYQWGWVARFLDESSVSLAIGIFLIFPLVTIASFWISTGEGEQSRRSLFGRTAALAAVVPLSFAFYLAAVPGYAAHRGLLFSFLLAIDIGLAVIAASARGPRLLHPLGALSTTFTFVIWSAIGYRHDAWPSILVWIAGFVLLYSLAPTVARRLRRPLVGGSEKAVFGAPVLLFMFAALALLEPLTAAPVLLFSVLAVLLLLVGFAAAIEDAPTAWMVGAVLTLIAEAVWSVEHLTADRVIDAVIVYAAFGVILAAVPMAVRRWKPDSEVGQSGLPMLFLGIFVLFVLATGPDPRAALPGLTALLLGLNLAMAREARHSRRPALAPIGTFISWMVLGGWWIAAENLEELRIGALVSLVLFAVMVVVAYGWLSRERAESTAVSGPSWLALISNLFLLAIAGSPSLSIPPWPWLVALGVIALAITVQAVRSGDGGLMALALGAGHFVLIIWVSMSGGAPWPSVAISAAAALAAMGLLAFAFARRRFGSQTAFRVPALIALFGAQFVLMFAVTQAGAPGSALLALIHGGLVIAILSICAIEDRHLAAVLAVVSSFAVVFLARGLGYHPGTWLFEMILGGITWLLFLGYPLVLGDRAKRTFEPWLAGVLAGVPLFFYARTGMLVRGLDSFIGLLPVIEAAVTSVLLIRLLKLEPRGERQTGRLAMVAGTILAFVTVAVPLQFDREWITLGWALEGAALIWLFRRVPHRGLLVWSSALFGVAFIRLSLNPAVFDYHPRSATPILNWYLYAYLVAAAAYFAGARLLPHLEDAWRQLSPLLVSGGTVLLFLLVNIEIADFYSTGRSLTFNFSAGLAQDLTYTLAWAVFAIGMLVAGLIGGSRGARMAAIALLLVSVLKGFLHDLMRLGGLYRVGSLIGLAFSLAIVALLLQRFLRTKAPAEPA